MIKIVKLFIIMTLSYNTYSNRIKCSHRIKWYFSLIIQYDGRISLSPPSSHTHTPTQTYIYVNTDILLLTLFFASIEAPASISILTTSVLPLLAASIRAVLPDWWKYINQGKLPYQTWLSITHCRVLHSCTQMTYYHIQCQIMQ